MNALVLGGAVAGTAAVSLLERLDAEITIFDERPEAVAPFETSAHRTASGAWDAALLDNIDVVIASPGFAPGAAAVVAADEAGLPVWNEVELALQQMTCPIVAVTGTNGKTTVVELTTAMLKASGMVATAAGNIGHAISNVALDEWDAVVLEMSSFQLARTESLRPRVAVLLNLAPDHLDWHGTFEHYATSKARIFQHLGVEDVLVYDADDAGASALVDGAPGRHVPVSGSRRSGDGFGVEGDALVVPGSSIDLDRLQVTDVPYRMDLAAAAVAASELGATREAVESVMVNFSPGVHRRSVVGTWDEITWVNDSKATNPHAALAAIDAYENVVLIAGGQNKGLDLSPIAAAPNVRHYIVLGEAANEMLTAIGDRPATRVASIEEAIQIAEDLAIPGDTVLLSPGATSWDMFGSYKERGDLFTRLVLERKEQR